MRTYTLDEMRQLILARKSVEEPLLDTSPAGDAWLDANAVAHLAMLLQGEIQSAYDDFWPWSASEEALEGLARQWLTVPRLAATAWEGFVVLTSSETTPPDVPAGLTLETTDGVEYETTEAVGSGGIAWSGTAGAWTASPAAQATEAGANGNRDIGTVLVVQSPPAGLSSNASIGETTTSGSDTESLDRLRSRILLATSYRPGAGSPADYVMWAMEADSSVARAYVYPRWMLNAVRSVVVVPLKADPREQFSAGELAAIHAYIDERRPVGADVAVINPTPSPYYPASMSFYVHCRAGYGPDFVPPSALTLLAGSTTTHLLHDDAGYTIPVGSRVVAYYVDTSPMAGTYAAQRVVVGSGGGWVDVSEPFPAAPIPGAPLESGGPIWQAVHDAVVAWFCSLGPAVSDTPTQPRFPPPSYDDSPSGLYRSDFYRTVDAIEGVQVVIPDTPTFATDYPLTVTPGNTPEMYMLTSPRVMLLGAIE